MSALNRHEEIWRQLAGELQGQFVDGGFWKEDKVEARWESWIITLDKYVDHGDKSHRSYTRLRAPYVNPDSFRFSIYRRGLFSDLAKRDRKSTRLNSSHLRLSRMPSSA